MDAIDDRRPAPDVPERLNLARHVLWENGAADDQIALSVLSLTGAERWSYGRLRQAVMAVAGGLYAKGLSPGDRVLLRLGNRPAFPIAYLGAIAAGILPVPTSAALGEQEVTKLAERAKVKAVIGGDGTILPQGDCRVFSAFELLDETPIKTIADTLANDPAYILFTSGTSGDPLGVIHAHRAIWARGRMIEGWYGLSSTDRMLHAGAFNWSFTLGTGLMDPWSVGATALVLAEGVDSGTLPLLAKRHQATIIAGAPGVYRKLLQDNLPDLPQLRHGLSAGEKLSESLRARWNKATGTEIHEAFGQTECSTFISGNPGQPAPKGTFGRVQHGRAVAVLSKEGPVQRGELGKIAVYCDDPGLAVGFLGAARERKQQDWFLTGDLARMDASGAVTHLGRNDDLMNAGGYRVSPQDVETVLAAHPDVQECAVAAPEIRNGVRIITGFVIPAPTAQALTEAALLSHCAARLAGWKCPKKIVFTDRLPKTANGKVVRRHLGL